MGTALVNSQVTGSRIPKIDPAALLARIQDASPHDQGDPDTHGVPARRNGLTIRPGGDVLTTQMVLNVLTED
jgi:hypothetical protein